MKKYIKHSPEFKAEVTAYAKITSHWDASEKYGIKKSTVEYWAKPALQEKMKKKHIENWAAKKAADPEFLNKWAKHCKEARQNAK
ncbi:MAG: hypothetical protein WCK25_02155 [Actinomycetes bacterium]